MWEITRKMGRDLRELEKLEKKFNRKQKPNIAVNIQSKIISTGLFIISLFIKIIEIIISIIFVIFAVVVHFALLIRKIFTGKPILARKLIFGKKAIPTQIAYFNLKNQLLRNLALFYYVILGKLSLTGIGIREYNAEKRIIGDSYAYSQKPGIFNLWYIRESSRTGYEGKLDTDLEYIYTRGYLKDFLLILKTLPAMVYNSKKDSYPSKINMFGIKLLNKRMREAITLIERLVKYSRQEKIFFVNPDCLNKIFKDKTYYRILKETEYIFPDGIGINIAAKMLNNPLLENLNGTDMLPYLCENAVKNRFRIFLLGAQPGVAEKAKANLIKKFNGLQISGTQHGYFGKEEEQKVIEKINKSKTDILLVALGVPKQEKWICGNLSKLQVKVAMGVGGLFDFYSGKIKRAPRWMREVGLEWLYRVLQEPKRMWRRYIIGNPLFLLRVIKWKMAKQNIGEL
ncbi:MAG: hypothetical protein PWQ09_915 [Candidatus Cloacimonadota bacterium]|nr:hypothetical protein [Candidatus Cloacimonadota bacterium]